MKKTLCLVVLVWVVIGFSSIARAQEAQGKEKTDEPQSSAGRTLPNSERIRYNLRFMAGYGFDAAQSTLGFEKQGRVGYFVFAVFGKLNKNFSYLVEANPINETHPQIACGEPGYFYPNAAGSIGPNVSCSNDGRTRVDDYRYKALDVISQQGPVRQAFLSYRQGSFAVKFGRFILPIGFGWEEVGSLSSKDAPHIQRINAEANFGVEVSVDRRLKNGRRMAQGSVAIVTGDGNKYHDYDYFYGIDGSLDSNSWQTVVLSASTEPINGLEFRGAYKRGDTGSKVERLPNFYASKRNDNAMVLSARYSPIKNIAVFGESAHYTWGLMKTSAELLKLDPAPVKKQGFYIGADVSYPLSKALRVGTVVTREELSRDDALVKYLSELNMYNIFMGKHERSTVIRVYADISEQVRVGVYRNSLSNPYPWLSGIVPVEGPNAFQPGRGSDKWGVIVQFNLK
ncbi:MAG: hypothetical protein KW793_01935 [Candidatus Doudnabacteria bacterium]|nr:hypothetical protein [Candidatus Doudnabacteria bacterium]